MKYFVVGRLFIEQINTNEESVCNIKITVNEFINTQR